MAKYFVCALLIPAFLLISCVKGKVENNPKVEKSLKITDQEKLLVFDAIKRSIKNVKSLKKEKWGNFPDDPGPDNIQFPSDADRYTEIYGVNLNEGKGIKTYLISPPNNLDNFLAVEIDISKGEAIRVYHGSGA